MTKRIKTFMVFTSCIKFIYQRVPVQFKCNLFKTVYIDSKGLELDYLSDLFDAVYFKYSMHFDDPNKIVTIALSSKILKQKYKRDYKLYVEFLVEHGYVELYRDYFAGSHCKTYQINKDKFKNLQIVEHLNKNYNLISYYNKQSNSTENNSSKFYSSSLIKALKSNLNYVTINVADAVNELKLLYPDTCSQKYYKNYISVKNIGAKTKYLTSDNYGRIHTNFTVLKKEIKRKHIRIDGRQIYECDIKNSQPLFLLYLISRNIDDSIDEQEIRRLSDLTLAGTLYEELNTDKIFDKNKIKRRMFKYMFGQVTTKTKFKEFKRQFPTIDEFLENYKFAAGDYKELAYELQRSEGNFIFNIICKELIDQRIKFFTVHDSICVAKDKAQVLKPVFYKHLDKLKSDISANINNYYSD